jgi:hypothetical protein
MPALVLGLEDPSTVRAKRLMDIAILLHDGLTRTNPTSICHVLPYGTTRLVVGPAFSGRFLGLGLVPAKWRDLVPPTSG